MDFLYFTHVVRMETTPTDDLLAIVLLLKTLSTQLLETRDRTASVELAVEGLRATRAELDALVPDASTHTVSDKTAVLAQLEQERMALIMDIQAGENVVRALETDVAEAEATVAAVHEYATQRALLRAQEAVQDAAAYARRCEEVANRTALLRHNQNKQAAAVAKLRQSCETTLREP